MKHNCATCQNWNDSTTDCAVAERAIANGWDVPLTVTTALDLPSQNDDNNCDEYISN